MNQSNNTYVVSDYNITIPLKYGKILAYNAFSGSMVLLESHENDILEQIQRGRNVNGKNRPVVEQLAYGGFIVDKDFNERDKLETEYRLHRYNQNIMTLTIAPTMACNFACDYCYQGKEKNSGSMSPGVQDAVASMVRRSVSGIGQLHLAWYGGEPLLKKDIIKSLSERFIEICRKHGIQYDASMVTNGYLLDVDTINNLHAWRIDSVQVTFDGPRESHDARRVLLSGKPTFEKIVDNLNNVVDKTPIRFSTRVNVDSRNIEKIPELFALLRKKGLADKSNFGIYFSPVEAMTKGCHDIAGFCLGKLGYGRREADLYRLCFENGLTGLPYPPRFHGTCAAVKAGGFVVTPNGDIHKCWHTVSYPERRIGTVFNPDDLIKNGAYAKWLEWNPFKDETCGRCKLLPVCTGSCGYKFLYPADARGEAASLPCISWKYNIKERLLLRAEKTDVIKQEDYDPEMIATDPDELCVKVF